MSEPTGYDMNDPEQLAQYNAERASQINSGGGAGGGFAGAGSTALAGAAAAPILIALILPGIIVKVFDVIVKWLAAFGIVGRVIMSVLVGTVFGIGIPIILSETPLFSASVQREIFGGMSNEMGSAVVVIVCFALPTLWVYFSHYFTLQAVLVKSQEKTGKMSVFVKPFAIAFYGFILVALIHGLGSVFKFFNQGGWSIPAIGFWIPIIAGFVYYIVQSLSVSKEAREARKEEGLKPLGGLIALALTCIFPLILANADAKVEAAKERGADAAMIFYALSSDDNLYTEPNANSNAVKKLKDGDRITATGNVAKASKATDGLDYVEVSFNGTTGWVRTYNTHTILGTATVIADNATWEHYGSGVWLRNRPIPNGATVDIVGYKKKEKKTKVMYQNLYGDIDTKLIQQ